ncbi:YitT family protein [Conchiformibius steedae DSM 2580]|uniref:YitT family protein n=1 Tax=Conchiformibius steedae DSM 2580 TaxID=1121352 RepID=A0AAE9I0V6_9NEIS|nr:membrane protein [Conchiformibius steedae]QMT33667.1 YitT family protein [Conchiformibius steedae]URD68326.1 YitT family protein [Conchiformibius steedae DSM 2580]
MKNRKVLPHTRWSAPSLWRPTPLSLTVLLLSLALFGVGEAMLVLGALGSTPWTVLAQGIALTTGVGLGWVTFAVSAVVLLLWLPLRMRPGIGTLCNMVVIAAVLGLMVQLLPAPDALWARLLLCMGGVLTVGTASALYLTCHLGAGPRDGLMVGICRATGWRIGVVRTALEVSVCAAGWLLGGTFGAGTLLFAFGVGWVVQAAVAWIAPATPSQ